MLFVLIVHFINLQAKIAFLQGERKGQENLKNDLVRRIKMLEYALQKERLVIYLNPVRAIHQEICNCSIYIYRAKLGPEHVQGDINAPVFDEPGATTEITVDSEAPFTSVSNITWKQGRSLLRQ